MDETWKPLATLFVLLLIQELLGWGFTGVFFGVWFLAFCLACILGFIIQLFNSEWTFAGTTRNWLVFFCCGSAISIIIYLS